MRLEPPMRRGRTAMEVIAVELPGDRIVRSPDDVGQFIGGRDLSRNQIIENLTGFTDPVVWYGSTGLPNIFEFLSAYKLAYSLGLPLVFDYDPAAHKFGYYWRRSLAPLAQDYPIDINKLGLNTKAGNQQIVSNNFVAELLRVGVDIRLLYDRCLQLNGEASVCLDQLQLLAIDEIALALDDFVRDNIGGALSQSGVPYQIVQTQELLADDMLDLTLRGLAAHLRLSIGPANVVNLYDPDTGEELPISTDDIAQRSDLQDLTVREMYQQGLGFLGGAAIYSAIYQLGDDGPIVCGVKASSKGEVHRSAARAMEAERNMTMVSPMGLFRMRFQGQAEDDQVDPLILWSILFNQSPEARRQAIRAIWEGIDAPLPSENELLKTVLTISRDGISTDVIES